MSRRALLAVAVFGALCAIAVVAQARGTTPIVTSADLAVTELYTEIATRGQLLVGPYSRFGWHHPGPIYFYVLAPLYAAGGHQAAALFGAAVALNLAAILTLAWVSARDDRGPRLALVTMACLAFVWRVPHLLASPWTAHVPVLAGLAFVVVGGSIAGGRHRLLPLLMLLGSFVAQTHVSYVPVVGALSVVAIAASAVQRTQETRAVIGASAGVLLLLWLPALAEALLNDGGNIAALWQFFVANGTASRSVAESFGYWSYGLTGILRADLSLPWGGHIVVAPTWWMGPFALGQVVSLALVSWRSSARGHLVEAGVAGCAAIASVLGLWAITRIHGDVLDHELFWLVALGALNLGILAGAIVNRIWQAAWSWRDRAGVAVCVIALLGIAERGVTHLQDFTSDERRRSDTPRIPATYEILRDFFDQRAINRPLFRLDADAWGDAAGILLRLRHAGRSFAVDDMNAPMFAAFFKPSGNEDALVNLSSREGIHLEIAARPGNVVLRDRHPLFVDVLPVPARAIPR